MFQSVWLKSKLINLIEMHHYATISKMWCEKYIEWIINVFSHLRNELYIWEFDT
jgi:hypothetical protein